MGCWKNERVRLKRERERKENEGQCTRFYIYV